ESEMLRRLKLPADDDDHMPPSEKPQPTAEEIAAIEKWIAAGAPLDSPGAPQWGAAAPTPAGDPRTGDGGDPAPKAAPASEASALPGVAPADPAAIEALRSKLVHVEALAKDSNLLVVSFSAVAKGTGDSEAKALLEPILVQVADLTLARS